MTTTNYARTAADFRETAFEIRRQLERQHGGFVKCREVEIIPLDGQGERCGDPEYCKLAELSGTNLLFMIEVQRQCYAACRAVCVEIGYDHYESRRDIMEPDADYEPRIDHYSIELPVTPRWVSPR
jgi:hypothetical protein